MIRLLHPLALMVAILALSAGNAAAQDRFVKPPPQIEDHVIQCLACHGEDGRPVVEDAPIIYGQELYYLFVQLRDFAAGRRQSEIMTPIAKDLDRKQMEAASARNATWAAITATAAIPGSPGRRRNIWKRRCSISNTGGARMHPTNRC
jgi:cytochrome c553